jgi:hypothetical protein
MGIAWDVYRWQCIFIIGYYEGLEGTWTAASNARMVSATTRYWRDGVFSFPARGLSQRIDTADGGNQSGPSVHPVSGAGITVASDRCGEGGQRSQVR